MSKDSFSLLGKGGVMNAQQFSLENDIVCIGTDPDSCAILYPRGTAGIAPMHCQIVPQDDGWLIIDFSESGVWLNGRRMSKGQPMPLKEGDEIIIANANNRFVVRSDCSNPPIGDDSTTRGEFSAKILQHQGAAESQRVYHANNPDLAFGFGVEHHHFGTGNARRVGGTLIGVLGGVVAVLVAVVSGYFIFRNPEKTSS